MNILIASRYLPWPLQSGGNAAQYSTLKCLQEDHSFTLVCPIFYEEDIENAKDLQSALPRVKVRAVWCGWHDSWSSKALQIAKRANAAIRGNSQSGSAETPSYPFSRLPRPLIDVLAAELTFKVDLFQAEFAEMLPLAAWVRQDVKKVFIHHQVHFVYTQRFLAARPANAYSSYLAALMQDQECLYLQHYDGVIAFSEEDRLALLTMLPEEKVFASPFPLPIDSSAQSDCATTFTEKFIFLASGAHPPNRDGLEWLLDAIWPNIVRRIPGACLVVIGAWRSELQKRFQKPGVRFTGFVENLGAEMSGGIMLVPLRIGSGLRVKIMTAMVQGVPVLSTSVGSEGLLIENDRELLIADTEAEFAEAAVRLAQDAPLRRRLIEAAKITAETHYSPEAVRERRNEIYGALVRA